MSSIPQVSTALQTVFTSVAATAAHTVNADLHLTPIADVF